MRQVSVNSSLLCLALMHTQQGKLATLYQLCSMEPVLQLPQLHLWEMSLRHPPRVL